jgi:hypothetical protein
MEMSAMTDFGVLPSIYAVGFGLAVLAAATAFALRRAAPTAHALPAARRSVRVLVPSFLFSGGLALFFTILFGGRAQFPRIVLGFLVIMATALVVLVAFDLIAAAAGASRVGRWLIIVLTLLFVLPFVALVASSGWASFRSFDAISLALIAPAAALIWWSLLPPVKHRIGGVFE